MVNFLYKTTTTKEASLKYDVSDKTLRKWLSLGVLEPGTYRKSGDTWLIDEDSLIKTLKEKNMYRRKFLIENEPIFVQNQICITTDGKEIWTESEMSYKALEKIGLIRVNKVLIELIDSLDKSIKYILIDDNNAEDLNSYYENEEVLLVTLKAVKNLISPLNR